MNPYTPTEHPSQNARKFSRKTLRIAAIGGFVVCTAFLAVVLCVAMVIRAETRAVVRSVMSTPEFQAELNRVTAEGTALLILSELISYATELWRRLEEIWPRSF